MGLCCSGEMDSESSASSSRLMPIPKSTVRFSPNQTDNFFVFLISDRSDFKDSANSHELPNH